MSALAAVPLAFASGASADTAPPPVLQPGQTTPAHAQTWTMGSAPGGPVSNVVIGICQESFVGPSADITSGMTSGVYVQCSQSAALTVGTVLDRCVREGGPDDFDCSPVASNYSGLVNQYYVNVQASYTCSHSKSAQYRARG